jgi:hypothetical protein
MPKFKVYVEDAETGKQVEDLADGTYSSEEEAAKAVIREMEALSDIAEVTRMVKSLGGSKRFDTITREQAATIVTLAITDLVRSFREFIDEADLTPTDRNMLLETGRELMQEVGADLDRLARMLVGAEETYSKLN